jgi:hypothetical protein
VHALRPTWDGPKRRFDARPWWRGLRAFSQDRLALLLRPPVVAQIVGVGVTNRLAPTYRLDLRLRLTAPWP